MTAVCDWSFRRAVFALRHAEATAQGIALASIVVSSVALSLMVVTPAAAQGLPGVISAAPSVRTRPTARPRPPAPQAKAEPAKLSRAAFTQAELEAASIPGIPDARFWGDRVEAYQQVLGEAKGPWLAISVGGEDGAFSVGVLNGLSQSGRRPDYAVVTGASAGALMAPFAFLGSSMDETMHKHFTTVMAPDVFDVARTPESLVDTWPLKGTIAKLVTPEVMQAVAAEHAKGRRLIIETTNLDAGRPVAWNMGAIAAHGGEDGLKLFREVLLASSAIPAAFPPAIIESQSGGKTIQEMHVDGGLSAPFYIAPDAMLFKSDAPALPMSDLTVLINSKLTAGFSLTERSVTSILGRFVDVAMNAAIRIELNALNQVAARTGLALRVGHVDPKFDAPRRGPFDPAYLQALYEAGVKQGLSANPYMIGQPASAVEKRAAQ